MEMPEEKDLIAQAMTLTPIYIDGFGAFRKENGVFRAVGFCNGYAQLSIIMSIIGARETNVRARNFLTLPNQNRGLELWEGKSAH